VQTGVIPGEPVVLTSGFSSKTGRPIYNFPLWKGAGRGARRGDYALNARKPPTEKKDWTETLRTDKSFNREISDHTKNNRKIIFLSSIFLSNFSAQRASSRRTSKQKRAHC
jgi:hypothetical protein